MARKLVIGVDLGGTKILTGIGDRQGKILHHVKKPTLPEEGIEAVVNRIVSSIREVISRAGVKKEDIAGVGVGSPGPLNTRKGLIYEAPNLGWENVPLSGLLEKALGLPVYLENDANAAALGLNRFGEGRGSKEMIYVTVSTGIGGGLILNGKIYHGTGDGAGEIGHMTIEPRGPKCNCGKKGCWEALASGTALIKQARKALKEGRATVVKEWVQEGSKLDGALLARAAREGDSLALELFDRQGFYLGIGLANLINLFNPELILLGGGVTASWDLFSERMLKTAKEYSMSAQFQQVRIVKSTRSDQVGLLGAIAVAWEKIK